MPEARNVAPGGGRWPLSASRPQPPPGPITPSTTRPLSGPFIVFSHIKDPNDWEWLEPAICHELAHHWAALGGFLRPDHWMSEAFPEYIGARYARARFGEDAFERKVDQWREQLAGLGPVWTPEATNRPSGGAMYVMAPYLLYRLEQQIGSEVFDRFVERYMVDDVRSTEVLLQILAEIAGPGAAETLRQELGSRGSDLEDR